MEPGEGIFERAERLLAELLAVYTVAPPAVRRDIRDKVIRSFARPAVTSWRGAGALLSALGSTDALATVR